LVFNNNDNYNTQTVFIVVFFYGIGLNASVHSGPQSGCWSAPGGRQLVGQAAHLSFESACRLL